MNDAIGVSRRTARGLAVVLSAMVLIATASTAQAQTVASDLKVTSFLSDTRVELTSGRTKSIVARGERFGSWTFMEVVRNDKPFVVLEDFQNKDGRMLFVDSDGVRLDLRKTLEPSTADPKSLYLGHTLNVVLASDTDLLAKEILAKRGDPTYDEVAAVFPPLQKITAGTFSFVGTPDTFEKIGFAYGGRTSYFDPAVYEASIKRVRDAGNLWHGLVGGYLPVMRFVYPDSDDTWTEMLAFAPFRVVNGNTRVQPTWYRVTRIEHGKVLWSRHIDSYQPFPPREADDAAVFYSELADLKSRWDDLLRPGMQIKIPDTRIADMARFGLVRAIMTRVDGYPKYGAVDKNYGGNEHDGFPDTFNVETTAMIEWGLLDRAGAYIDNYFDKFVRDDGSILYRGPETGQFGRMLTVLAHYANAGGSRELLLTHRRRIDAVTRVLLGLRAKALLLPASSPAFGMIAGWSEADSSLDPEPSRYTQPYFSNSTEAARGFRDLGEVWRSIGNQTANAELTTWGERLVREASTLRQDIDTSIARSQLIIDGTPVLPAIAGAKEPFHVAVQRDRLDPQHRSYRAYMEMMYSGSLSPTQVRSIVEYRAGHRDILLGIPTAYGYDTREVAGFLLYGHGYGLIQHDMIREALLTLYSDMAHQYTRGMWLAPETRRPLSTEDAAPYCTPAQLIVPLFTRWLLVFEDPQSETLWLGKAVPRQWLEDGRKISVSGATTQWGKRLDFSITSNIRRKSVAAQIVFPNEGLPAETRLRLRVPNEARMKSVTLNGARWNTFDPASESISVPAGTAGTVDIVAHY
jgi:hypothetical protein